MAELDKKLAELDGVTDKIVNELIPRDGISDRGSDRVNHLRNILGPNYEYTDTKLRARVLQKLRRIRQYLHATNNLTELKNRLDQIKNIVDQSSFLFDHVIDFTDLPNCTGFRGPNYGVGWASDRNNALIIADDWPNGRRIDIVPLPAQYTDVQLAINRLGEAETPDELYELLCELQSAIYTYLNENQVLDETAVPTSVDALIKIAQPFDECDGAYRWYLSDILSDYCGELVGTLFNDKTVVWELFPEQTVL